MLHGYSSIRPQFYFAMTKKMLGKPAELKSTDASVRRRMTVNLVAKVTLETTCTAVCYGFEESGFEPR